MRRATILLFMGLLAGCTDDLVDPDPDSGLEDSEAAGSSDASRFLHAGSATTDDESCVPVYIDDPRAEFQDIDTGSRRRHLHAWTRQGFTFNFGTTQHIQGIARFPQSNWMVLSGNPSDQGRIALVELASKPERPLLGSNSDPPPQSDKLVKLMTVSTRFGHAGGLGICGNIVAVPVEADTMVRYYERSGRGWWWSSKQSEIRFLVAPAGSMEGIYDLSDRHPEAIIRRYYRGGPFPLWPDDYETRGAGVVALTRLLTGPYGGHYLVAIYSGGPDGKVEFYLSRTTSLADGFEFASSAWSDWFVISGAGMQNLDFVPSSNGDIYLFGSSNTESSGLGADKARIAKVNFNGLDAYALDTSNPVTPEGELHFECDDGHCNFAAGSGLYISQHGKLALYGTIHSTWGASGGPTGYTELIRITEFPWAQSPPVADAGPDQTVSAGPDCTASVSLDGSGSWDPDGDPLTYRWTWNSASATGIDPTIRLHRGTHTVTLVVNDGTSDSSPDEVEISVVDDSPPELMLSVDPETLWPPDHKMVPVTVMVIANDNCDPSPFSAIESVTSNEDIDGSGDGTTAPDWAITGDLTLALRAERSGAGSNRVYVIEVVSTDSAGNAATEAAEVTVPHARRRHDSPPVDVLEQPALTRGGSGPARRHELQRFAP